ncbi:MAG: hypothetical protein QS721_00570 [Candidatus Endonucleobacter sp. (ex Gigantidas childressi)]|nr:hypothetical protein [Candidatus Endonucleobacter sp. (ex Gigantidas childressi)]
MSVTLISTSHYTAPQYAFKLTRVDAFKYAYGKEGLYSGCVAFFRGRKIDKTETEQYLRKDPSYSPSLRKKLNLLLSDRKIKQSPTRANPPPITKKKPCPPPPNLHTTPATKKDNSNTFTTVTSMQGARKLGSQLSEVFDYEWTNAEASIRSNNTNIKELDDKSTTKMLLNYLMISHEVCKNNTELNNDAKESIILNKIKTKYPNFNIDDENTKKYIKKCTEICTEMCGDLDIVFGDDIKYGDSFRKKEYKQYEFKGSKVDYIVWPSLHLKHEGQILMLTQGWAKPIEE